MAGKFVYTSSGARVWVEDGANTDHPINAPGGGFKPGPDAKGAGPGGGVGYGNTVDPSGYLPNYDYSKVQAGEMWKMASAPNAITAAHVDPSTIDRTASDAVRAQQYAMLAALEKQAAGGGPSVANAMTAEGMDTATRMAMTARPGAGGLRAAIGAGSNAYGQAATSGAAMRAGEQQNAWKALTGASAGVRGMDIDQNAEQAKLNQQAALANAGFATQANIANQGAALAGMANRMGVADAYGGLVNANTDARLGMRAYNTGIMQRDKQWKQAQQDRRDRQYAQAIDTFGKVAMVMASDEREKTDVKEGGGKLRQMLDALSAYEYRYKDTSREGTAPGKHISVMAQDLEKSELGSKAVFDSEQGHKMVDYGKLAPTMLAGLAMLNKRINELEKR